MDVHVILRPGTAAPLQVKQGNCQGYLRAAEVLRQENQRGGERLNVSFFAAASRGVISGLSGRCRTEEDQERLALVLEGCLGEGRSHKLNMRRAEGKHLVEELPLGAIWRASAGLTKKCAGWW